MAQLRFIDKEVLGRNNEIAYYCRYFLDTKPYTQLCMHVCVIVTLCHEIKRNGYNLCEIVRVCVCACVCACVCVRLINFSQLYSKIEVLLNMKLMQSTT